MSVPGDQLGAGSPNYAPISGSANYAPLASPTFTGGVTLSSGGDLTLLNGDIIFSQPGEGIQGGTSGTVPVTGNVGNYVVSAIAPASAVTLSSGVVTNLFTQAVSAGHYLIALQVNVISTTATMVATSPLKAGISTTTGAFLGAGAEGYNGLTLTLASSTNSVPVNSQMLVFSSPGTIYGLIQATFSAGTVTAFGEMTIITMP